MEAATSATACKPDEHCLLTVLIGTESTARKRRVKQETCQQMSLLWDIIKFVRKNLI